MIYYLPYHDWYFEITFVLEELNKAYLNFSYRDKQDLSEIYYYLNKRFENSESHYFDKLCIDFPDHPENKLDYWLSRYPESVLQIHSWRIFCDERKACNSAQAVLPEA